MLIALSKQICKQNYGFQLKTLLTRQTVCSFSTKQDDEKENTDKDKIFRPSQKLNFTKGFLNLYNYTYYEQGKGSMIIMMSIASAISLYCLNKLLNAQDRSWFGMFVYAAIFIYTAPLTPRFYHIIHQMAIKVDLKKGGTVVRVTLPKLIFSQKTKEYDISEISRSTKKGALIKQLYSVKFENDILLLSKDGEMHYKEILNEIFEGKYIDTDHNDN